MKKNLQFIEPLEARIAPAVLVNGGNLLGGSGNPTTGETSTGGNTVTLIKVLSGQALVFFNSANSEITGISVGQHTKLDITGNVFGDIVTNLLPNGHLTDSDNNPANGEDGGVLLGIGIKGITTHKLGTQNGDIGRIIAGGAVKNINVAGQLDGLYTGDGIFRDGSTALVSTSGVDYNTVAAGVQDQFLLSQAAAQPYISAGINKVVVGTANQLEIFAGDGTTASDGTGLAGGSITNVTITKTLTGEGTRPALSLHAGDGGAATSGNGGDGGSISNFDDQGSIAYVRVQTGNGGASTDGHGGNGGSLTASTISTSSPRYDLFMGFGGAGSTAGGAGGTISTLNFTNNVNGGQSLVTTGDFNNDGVQDVLLVNTLTGEATLSLGHVAADGTTSFSVALQPTTNANGSAGATPFIAAEGAVPTSVATADLNGDGNLDFVVSYASTDSLGIFLGHGDGTFTASSVALSASPTKIAVADFVGTSAPDIAVLSAASVTSASGSSNSQVFLLQNDGTAHFTTLANPTIIAGVGTDLAAAQIDKTGGTDLFVGLTSGSIDTLLANGTTFTPGATISGAFVSANGVAAPVTNLDVGSPGDTTSTLLAFSANVNVNDPNLATTVVPQVDIFTVNTAGAEVGVNSFQPTATSSVTAHFVKGTAVVGVVAPGALSLYSYQETGYGVLATLSSDGALNDFTGFAGNNGFQIVAVGAATNRFFYTAGDPASITGLPALAPVDTPFEPRIISFVAGDGGHGGSDVGGAGGDITSLTYTQALGGGVLEAGGTYETHVTTGAGGDSNGAFGGQGGDLSKVSLNLQAGYQNAGQDDTTSAFLTTGHGGTGTSGGAGGGISKVTSVSVFSQMNGTSPVIGAVAMQITSGAGGAGTSGAGGAGGAITLDGPSSLSGVSFFDPDSVNPEAAALQVVGGSGGAGVTAGGAGGTITNVGTQNAVFGNASVTTNELYSALIQGGAGGSASAGSGGAGGAVTGLNVGVEGTLTVVSGAGGDATGGVGGDAGTVSKSTVASVAGDPVLGFGLLVEGGHGGTGAQGGGAGGGVKKLTMNTPSTSDAFAAVLVGGDGGNATGTGAAGRGGTINGVTQSKDVNSTINTIQAGDGGTSANGAGGAGGSVKNVDTEGFIGLPSITTTAEGIYLGAFNDDILSSTISALFATGTSVPQGVFAGKGGSGANNGSVLEVVARQIAAIGATVNANGTFTAANTIDAISADLIGYDAGQDGAFTSTVPGQVSPATARPVDGFLLAGTYGTINITGGSLTRTDLFEFKG